MRWTMLAIALMVASASPAFAQQRVYGSRTPMHRATYNPSGESPVKYAGTRHVTASIHDEGCTSCATDCDSGCQGGCTSGGCASRGCCLPPLLPNLVDNVVDVFARFKPCPSKCGPCATTVHCCPYPKTMPPSNCCKRRLPGLLDSIFVCNKGCCKKKCGGCSTGCTQGCTGGATHVAAPYTDELIAPPAPMPEMRDPFKDDPVQQETKRTLNNKTTATQRHWYKTVRPAPVYAAEEAAPETFVVGNASPIYTGR